MVNEGFVVMRPKLRDSRWHVLSLIVALASACAGSQNEEPEIVASANVRAQQELREIEEAWQISSSIGRQALRPRLEEFIERYGNDPSAARARLLLARVALMEGRLGAAEEMLRPILSDKQGRLRDEAILILAALRNRQERPNEALELLRPLEGKLLTEESRYEYSLERARAALAARRWRLAVDTLTSWIAQSQHRQRDAKDWARKALVQVPAPALSRILSEWNERRRVPEHKQARQWIQRVIVEQLSKRALTERDPRLARDLLAHAPSWLRASDVGDELSLLAALAQEEARVSGRRVGIVMGGEAASSRRRSVQVGVGLMRGLRLAVGETNSSGVGLIAEEDRGSVRTALSSLSGQGAAVLVASVDPLSAMEALAFAETRRVPVVVLTPPMGAANVELDYGFSFGVGQDEQKRAIQEAMEARHSGPVVFVGQGEVRCPGSHVLPGSSSLPLESWRESGVRFVGILADSRCSKRVVRQSLGMSPPLSFVLGLEAAAGPLASLPAGSSYFYLSAGEYPQVQVGPPTDHYVAGEAQKTDRVIGWYEQLGRDLSALLSVALAEMPESVTTDPQQVRDLHDRARDALLGAEAELVTTDQKGFEGEHRLERELELHHLKLQHQGARTGGEASP